MTYVLGVDLGTTFTAAAIFKDGRASIASLGNQSAAIPSVLLLKEDSSILTGEAANRRGMTEPGRVARDFKRRVGDTTPIFLGGAPQSAEALMARLLRWVADEVTAREGREPTHLAVCHPANWGQYKQDLLAQAVRMADLGVATFVTEPEAAAIFYASEQAVEPGKVVAVYDLGGGTFDAAILRKTEDSFELLGRPEGIERLGGIDFDAAIFAHVARSLQGKLAELDEDDPVAMSAVARLRQECVEAKVALSTDSDVSVSVLLPNIQTEVRITRAEFEAMIRPSLADTIGAMRRAFASADLTADDVSAVLLVGGSSRIPLVAQMVGAELGRPVAVDTHPKHAVALGTAYAAAAAVAGPSPIVPAPASATPVAPVVASVAAPAPAPEAPSAPPPAAAPTAPPTPAPTAAPPVEPPSPATPAAQPTTPAAPATPAAPLEAVPGTPTPADPLNTVPAADGPHEPPPGLPVASPTPEASGKSKRPLLIAAAALVGVAIVGGVGFGLVGSGDDSSTDPDANASDGSGSAQSSPASLETVTKAVEDAYDPELSTIGIDFADDVVTLTGLVYDETTRESILDAAAGVEGVADVKHTTPIQSPSEQCNETVRGKDTWACFQDVSWDGNSITATFTSSASTGGADLDLSGSHLHIFGSNVAPETAGAPGSFSIGGGSWRVWDQPTSFEGTLSDIGSPDGVPDALCVRAADGNHQLEQRTSGNCWPITDAS
ncbi:hypothetical protein GCM10027020_28690 [Nocardioides salsibiostraticola]